MSFEFDLTVGIPDVDSETEKYKLTAAYAHTTTQEATTIMTQQVTESVTYECHPITERSGVYLY